MKFIKKYSILLASCASFTCPLSAAEELPRDNFEEFRNQGFREFFDKFSQGKFVELGFETYAERQKREEEFQRKETEELESKKREEETRRQEKKEAKRRVEEGIKKQLEESQKELAANEREKQDLNNALASIKQNIAVWVQENEIKYGEEEKKRIQAENEVKKVIEQKLQEVGHLQNALASVQQNIAVAYQTIEDLRKQLEASRREVDELRRAREAEIAQRTAAEAEQQRIQREKAAEAEQQRLIRQEAKEQRRREEQAKAAYVAEWNSSIDTTIQRIKDLKDSQLTFGESVKVLDAMEQFYNNHGDTAYYAWRELMCSVCGFSTYTKLKDLCKECPPEDKVYGLYQYAYDKVGRMTEALGRLLVKDVAERMEKYEQLRGLPHPRKDEFGRMLSCQ